MSGSTGIRKFVGAVVAVIGVALLAGSLTSAQALAQGQGPDFPKTNERNTYITKTPEFQAGLQQQLIDDNAELAEIVAAEAAAAPGDQRDFSGNVCAQHKQECAGDVRLYDWGEQGFGEEADALFGARSGATISAKVWATEEGPAKRPGIVITTGSVQAPEILYWSFAQVLAKRGFVVLTYDVQGQGRSDTYGEGVDRNEGVPSQAGQPFYDGTEDALDFLLSTQAKPYEPRPSCGNTNGGTGTSHAAKHQRRVDAGLNAAFNPFWELVDPERIGIAGHSLGAGAVSYIGQIDDRVDAIVAWDNLGTPSRQPACDPASAPRPDDPPITKPAIGMSNDYGLFPSTEPPNNGDPARKNGGFQAYKDAGVDSMQVNRRGGTHYEYSFIPGETVPDLGLATLRGNDMAVWYTAAWFEKYVKCQGDAACAAAADRKLLTSRWRNDPREGQVDYGGDPNLYSSGLLSRFDLTDASGAEQICDDVRAGCTNMVPDGGPPGYDFVAETKTLDQADNPGGGPGSDPPSNPDATPCSIGQRGSASPDTPATLPPTDGGDSISGRGGDDKIRGGLGPDCLFGNGGDDIVKGDEDDDQVRGGPGSDRTIGGSGDDDIRANDGRDFAKGGDGEDTVKGGRGADKLKGGGDRDTLKGGGGRDRLVGGDGDDIVRANKGRDKAKGGDGQDKVNGGKGPDQVVGGPGRDTLAGGDGNDVIKAADGERDRIVCNKGRRDKVIADKIDRVGRACDKVRIVG